MSTLLVKQLLQELSADLETYVTFREHLKKQHTLLVERNGHELTSVNHDLSKIISQLNNNAINRANLLKSLGLTPDKNGMQRLFNALPDSIAKQTQNNWLSLFKLTQECQELNNKNGRLLSRHKQTLDRLLKPEQQFSYAPPAN